MSTTATAMDEIGLIPLRFDESGADTFKRSWIMLLPEGTFSHPSFGKIDLTRKTLSEMQRNFEGGTRKIELALDYDHRAADGDSKAPGWIEAVEYREANGDVPAGLWAKVRWTPIGLSDVQNQIYRYVSAEFKPQYKDELSGTTFKNVLIGATLTNRPFMKQMPAIALSATTAKRRAKAAAAGDEVVEEAGRRGTVTRAKKPAESVAFDDQETDELDDQTLDDETEELDADEEEGEDDAAELAEKAPAGAAKGKQLPADGDEEDEADGGDDEDAEALDDPMGDEEYAEEEDDEEPPVKATAAAKGKGGSKKMSEKDAGVTLAENVKLRERVAQLEAEKFKQDIKGHFAAFGKAVRLADVDADEQVTVSRAFRTAYAQFAEKLAGESIKLGEGGKAEALLGDLQKLTTLALTNAVVPLTSFANKVARAERGQDSDIVDLDERRPRRAGATSEDQTEDADKIALSEHKRTIKQLAVEQPDAARAIYFRLDEARRTRHQA